MSWQPIATAPPVALKPLKIDIWIEKPTGDGYRVIDAFRDDYYGWAVKGYSGCRMQAAPRFTHTATHWMLPPKPPEAA